jgi:hypothetical protein
LDRNRLFSEIDEEEKNAKNPEGQKKWKDSSKTNDDKETTKTLDPTNSKNSEF